MNPNIFPAIMTVLQFLAALAYIPSKTWDKVVYWFAATIITISVTWMKK